MNPFTGSAGQVAHQPMNPTCRPKALAMFQRASTLRSVEETRTPLGCLGSLCVTKSKMP